MSGRELPGRMNPDFSFITSMVVSGYPFAGEQLLPSCTAGHTRAGGGGIMLWGTFSRAALEPVVVVEQTMKAANYLNITADQLHPYMAFVFPTGNGIFQQDNAPCHKARIVLEWFEEHTDEFHLMSWPSNWPDLNPMEHIWDVMERQIRAQTPPCPNISTLCDRCLDIWYNLSPVMYQILVASMPRRVAAVLKAKGGATRYLVGGHDVLALQCIVGQYFYT
ncbi:Transposable element Tcb2 transposase [Araneus ventricosus]|uniref:Transposable element Tcb2 transposase n=1 Tax=Araneus ventricosus TaxID=182803 RepID=A0A4Y2JXQ8_ARAVE|nr:Transposable element Tcb2 transposase [Araneus ventricosus]